jgi:hypothetical protein
MNDECVSANVTKLDNPYSNLDSRVQFNTDMTYGCIKKLTYNQFINFCINKEYKNLLIFNQTQYIQQLGIFGNADFNNVKDWTDVINDVDLNSGYLFDDEISCYLPTNIYFDVITAQAGPIDNPQNYILGGRLSTEYKYLFIVD